MRRVLNKNQPVKHDINIHATELHCGKGEFTVKCIRERTGGKRGRLSRVKVAFLSQPGRELKVNKCKTVFYMQES